MNKHNVVENFIEKIKEKVMTDKRYMLSIYPPTGVDTIIDNAFALVEVETKNIVADCKFEPCGVNVLTMITKTIIDNIDNIFIAVERNAYGVALIDNLVKIEPRPMLIKTNGKYGISGTNQFYKTGIEEVISLLNHELNTSTIAAYDYSYMEKEGDIQLRNYPYESLKAYMLALHAIKNIDSKENVNRFIAENLFGLIEGKDYGKWAKHDLVKLPNGEVDDFAYEYENHNGPRCSRCGEGFCRHCDTGEINDVCEILIPDYTHKLYMKEMIDRLRELNYVIGFEIDKDGFTCSIGIKDPENEDGVIYSVAAEANTMHGTLLDATCKVLTR